MSRARILFVDDDAQILRAMRVVLRGESERWDMVFVQGGEEAVALVRSESFDVIVTDLHMGSVSGDAVLRAARDRLPTAVRLLMSGACDFESEAVASELAQELIEKPCPSSRLRSTIERWLIAA